MNKKKSASKSAFFNPRILIGLALCVFGFVMTLFAAGVLPPVKVSPTNSRGAVPGTQHPDVVQMVGPVDQSLDLRSLPYLPPNVESEDFRLARHPFPLVSAARSPRKPDSIQGMLSTLRFSPNMPGPLMTFDAIDS